MKVGIIGLGLMGGSFGRTLTKFGHTVYGYDTNEKSLKKAKIINAITDTLNENTVKEVELLVVAVNPNLFLKALTPFIKGLTDGATVMDFCGTKRLTVSQMQDLAKEYKNLNFIGGHPMAGREFSGIEHSLSTLFQKASMIFVPVKADIFVLQKFKELFMSLEFGEVVITDAENHDKQIAFTSQLCHVVSNAFIKNERAKEHFGYSAGSYKDLTRVAKLDPNMWTGLMMENADNLSNELDELIGNLQKYSTALKERNEEKLYSLLKEGDDIKREIEQRS